MSPVTSNLPNTKPPVKPNRTGRSYLPDPVRDRVPAWPVSNLDSLKEHEIRWQVTAVKCSCRCVWCPTCWERREKLRLVERLRSFDPKRTRHVTLTVDRKKFKNGRECFETIMRKRSLGEMIKNLIRTDGVAIRNWVWVQEWHRDGFGHWHIFIEVEKTGSAGMIGGHILRARWPHGVMVNERAIMNNDHWEKMVGYFDKHGYFEKGQEYQGRLPKWALEYTKTIKRWDGMTGKKGACSENLEKFKLESWGGVARMGFEVPKKDGEGCSMGEKLTNSRTITSWDGGMVNLKSRTISETIGRKTYREVINGCGGKTRLIVRGPVEEDREGYYSNLVYDIEYKKVRKSFEWEWVRGKGLMLKFGSEGEVKVFFKKLLGLRNEGVEEERTVRRKESGDSVLRCLRL